jgi:hypothetical protein
VVNKRKVILWALKDLNLRPTDYESAALTAELRAQIILAIGLASIPPLSVFGSYAQFYAHSFPRRGRLAASNFSNARSTDSGEGCT